MKITLIVDNPRSWIVPYIKRLLIILKKKRHQVNLAYEHSKITKGDLVFFLSCEEIVKPKILKLNKHNLVVHESQLPKGRGWSPLTWQILAGKNKIPITLFEAAKQVDSGNIYLQDYLQFQGHELNKELKHQQGKKTINLILKFIDLYQKNPQLKGKRQKGKPTYYPKRTPQDSELNINKTIKAQFNLLRVVDNERYPAFFHHRSHKYILKIRQAKKSKK